MPVSIDCTPARSALLALVAADAERVLLLLPVMLDGIPKSDGSIQDRPNHTPTMGRQIKAFQMHPYDVLVGEPLSIPERRKDRPPLDATSA